MTVAPVEIESAEAALRADLVVPEGAHGVVAFAHGSGSGRHSPRNRFVAHQLNKARLATLLMDLLTEEEERVDNITGELRFNISLLARRTVQAARWLARNHSTSHLPVGIFGASTGAAAALVAAAEMGRQAIHAVASRGGRPDLAGSALRHVASPTLLIVGGHDTEVIALNEEARARLRCPVKIAIVPGATHLFEEPGTLGRVAELAAEWFGKYLVAPGD